MSQNTVSPLLMAKLNNNAAAAVVAAKPNVVVEDTAKAVIKEVKKLPSGKKFIAIGAAALAVSAIVVGGLIYKGRLFPEIRIQKDIQKALSQVPDVTREANTALEKAVKQYDEVTSIIQRGQNQGYKEITSENKLIQFIIDEANSGIKAIREYSTTGAKTLTRQTKIDPETQLPKSIEVFKNAGKSDFYTYAEDKCTSIDIDLERITSATAQSKVSYIYNSKDNFAVAKNVLHPVNEWGEHDMSKIIKAEYDYEFTDKKLKLFAKNYEYQESAQEDVITAEQLINFKDNKLDNITYNFGKPDKKYWEMNQGKLTQYEFSLIDLDNMIA
ncbi:hypothetical protein IJ531_00400 [bacterium]|nr:hypothetical protein [bacterium]